MRLCLLIFQGTKALFFLLLMPSPLGRVAPKEPGEVRYPVPSSDALRRIRTAYQPHPPLPHLRALGHLPQRGRPIGGVMTRRPARTRARLKQKGPAKITLSLRAPTGRGNLLVQFQQLHRCGRRLPRRFAPRNDRGGRYLSAINLPTPVIVTGSAGSCPRPTIRIILWR